MSTADNAYYARRSKESKARKVVLQRKRRKRLTQNVWDYKSINPCVDCGEADPIVLDFDHIKGKKLHNIADMCRGGFSWENILREIAKCEIRCANCHRRMTYNRSHE